MKTNKFFSIKSKLIAIILGVSTLSIAFGLGFIIFNNIKTFKDDMRLNTYQQAEFMAANSANLMKIGFKQELEIDYEAFVKAIPSILCVAVYDKQGNRYAFFDGKKNQIFPNRYRGTPQ